MKKEHPIGLHEVAELMKDVMAKYKINIKQLATTIPYNYKSVWNIYHSKRPAPVSVILRLVEIFNDPEGEYQKRIADMNKLPKYKPAGGSAMKKENPIGPYGVVALMNDVMAKYKMNMRQLAAAIPYSYSSVWGIYHSKRPAPALVILKLVKILNDPEDEKGVLALAIIEAEDLNRLNRVKAVE